MESALISATGGYAAVFSMDLDSIANKLDRFLYRKLFKKLTPEDLKLAETWSLDLIRKNHPDWDEIQVRRYYDNLLKIRAYAVDEWGRRLN